MLITKSLFVIFVIHFQVHDCAPGPRVRVRQGILEGQVLVPSTGRGQYYSFKGIPYTAPPIGVLRFKAPQPPLKWNGVRDAKEYGSICVQFATLTSTEVVGDEDCLFLNVYSPNINPQKPMAVMIFIHGGAFTTGSGNDDLYAPDFLIGYNIVLVTINYRLDCLGFLSVDTAEVPGNAGLLDQLAAFKWVQENIGVFGGDPDNVTIFGQSAGGSSVTYHLVSPAAAGLFKRALSMSGVLFNEFASTFQHRRRAFALGSELGINTTDANELISFLRKVPPKKLTAVRPKILLSDNSLTTQYYAPIVEKKFGGNQYLTEQPCALVCKRKINAVELLIGHTEIEGTRFVVSSLDAFLQFYSKYVELFVPTQISHVTSLSKVLELADQIKEHYFGNETVSVATLPELAKFEGYYEFTYDIHYLVDNFLPKYILDRVYFYIFAINSTRNVYSAKGVKYGIEGSTHRDDLAYIFDGRGYNLTVDVNSEAFQFVDEMCTLFTNFAKYGTPTPDDSFGLIWPTYGTSRTMVQIKATLTAGPEEKFVPDLGFWRAIYREAGVTPYIES